MVERGCIFELLKMLNITCVFVYCSVKLFLDTRGVSDRKRSGWPREVHTPQVINAVRSRTNLNPVQKLKKSLLGK